MSRNRPDSCPGALQLHQAADGPLARVRLPGGRLTPAQLQTLAEAARELGNGAIELTSRANVQLREVRDPDALAGMLTESGLLPSHTHERVRNIIASPLSGRVGGVADIRDLVTALDAGLAASPLLAELPGRVLFTLDDGRGDVTGLGADIGLVALDADQFALVLAGEPTATRLPTDTAVSHVLAAAEVFRTIRTDEWRLTEVSGGVDQVLAALNLPAAGRPPRSVDRPAPPIGWFAQNDGAVAVGAGVRFGSLDARLAEFLAAAEHPVIVTPWRGVVVCDLDEWAAEQVVRVLAPMGLIFDAESPWLRVTACTGQPGCAKSLADVRADAALTLPDNGTHVHWSGCDRRCGRPRDVTVTDIVATLDGYCINPPANL